MVMMSMEAAVTLTPTTAALTPVADDGGDFYVRFHDNMTVEELMRLLKNDYNYTEDYDIWKKEWDILHDQRWKVDSSLPVSVYLSPPPPPPPLLPLASLCLSLSLSLSLMYLIIEESNTRKPSIQPPPPPPTHSTHTKTKSKTKHTNNGAL